VTYQSAAICDYGCALFRYNNVERILNAHRPEIEDMPIRLTQVERHFAHAGVPPQRALIQ
jgi:hypothetical protein